MKLFYRPVGSDEPLKELCECNEPLNIKPIVSPDEVQEQEPSPFQPMEPITFDAKVEGLTKKLPKPKYPRKLKKAIGQMWDIKSEANTFSINFKALKKTRWQRKALAKVRRDDNHIEYPMKNGTTLSFVFPS